MMTRRWIFLFVGLLACAPSAAQDVGGGGMDNGEAPAVADTTAGTDTTTVEPFLFEGSPVGFVQPRRGHALSDSLPALRPEIDLMELLAKTPGTFTYLFSRPGWPDAWSPFGHAPNATPLSFNGIPFTHVFTGRPAFNLIPFTLIEAPRLEAARYGRPYGVLTRQRPFASSVPMTEGTYWRGGEGLQSIDVVHAQHRRKSLLGRDGFLNIMGAYSGRATDVEYPGSDLTRGRRVQLRLRYERPDWALEILDLHNRRRIGAHHGVVPPAGNFNAVYRGDLAEVDHPEAERRVIRNDLMATLHARLFATGPSAFTAYWTAETFRYRDRADTLGAESDRIGLHAAQPLVASSAHVLSIVVEAWTERIGPFARFDAPPQRRNRIYAHVRDTLRTAGWSAASEAGWDFAKIGGGPAASLTVTGSAGTIDLAADLSTTRPGVAVAYGTGFGSLRGLGDVEPGRTASARIEAAVEAGGVRVAAGLFGSRQASPVDVFAVGDSAAVRRGPSPLERAGAYADLGWRRNARRGFYATFRPTLTADLDAGASTFHRQAAGALPNWFGRARIGVRYAVFRGDLDFDVYLEGVAWAGSVSRRLHPETGLLLIPDAQAVQVGASNMLNVVAEVRVRTAKLYLVYDNALSGTTLLPGNFLVPIYPLPAQRFRFGVYWPIFE